MADIVAKLRDRRGEAGLPQILEGSCASVRCDQKPASTAPTCVVEPSHSGDFVPQQCATDIALRGNTSVSAGCATKSESGQIRKSRASKPSLLFPCQADMAGSACVVAEVEQNGVGTPYITPMTRRLKRRVDPEQSPYTCVLPERKPVRRGREMIALLRGGGSRSLSRRRYGRCRTRQRSTSCSNACGRLVRP